MKNLWQYSGPNCFNDADMMCVGIHGTGKSSNDLVAGKPGMTQTEYRTQFALWCMWSSLLTLSFALTKKISRDDLAIMTHRELIAINQDRMRQQAELISEQYGLIVFSKDLENGDVALLVTNRNADARDFAFDFGRIGTDQRYRVRDVWAMKDRGVTKASLKTEVASHETRVFRLSEL